MTSSDQTPEQRLTPEALAKIRRNDERDLRYAEKPNGSLDETAWERHVLLAEVDRLRTPPPPGELRGLETMCAALHAATETDPVVKEVAWRTFALIRAHREQTSEVDRLKAEVKVLGGQLQSSEYVTRNLARVIDVVALEIRRAVRLANMGDLAAAMQVIIDWASEADWLDNLNDDDNFDRPSAPTVEQQAEIDRLADGGE